MTTSRNPYRAEGGEVAGIVGCGCVAIALQLAALVVVVAAIVAVVKFVWTGAL